MRIRIAWDDGEVFGAFYDTPTARSVYGALPFESRASTWGKEVYFEVPAQATLEEDARQVVDSGTICFWVQGSSLALPFGPTPISQGDECRLVTAVNVLGMIDGDPMALAAIRDGCRVRVEAVA